jgi:hypothetical protein
MPDLTRLILPQPIESLAHGVEGAEKRMLAQLGPDTVFMQGDDPALPAMPRAPTLIDYFRLRCNHFTFKHLVSSGKMALDSGAEEKVVMASLLHDIALGGLVRPDHGYWSAQLIAPYVSEEIAWAVRYHQALRYFPDESVGYHYPEEYVRIFGAGYQPPQYIQQAHEYARNHRWYMTSRLVTLNDAYTFDNETTVDLEAFADIIGRNFRQPPEGLGFDGSDVAHMWRTLIWPGNTL